jgi:hypothetical protein
MVQACDLSSGGCLVRIYQLDDNFILRANTRQCKSNTTSNDDHVEKDRRIYAPTYKQQ